MFPSLRRPPGPSAPELPSAKVAPQTVDDVMLGAMQAGQGQGHGEPTGAATSPTRRAVVVATGAAYGCGPPCPQRRQHPLKCEGWCFGWMPGGVARGAALLYAREREVATATAAAHPAWRLPLHALVRTSGAEAPRRPVVVAWHLRY